MSVIRKTPYIEAKLGLLETEQLQTLKGILNATSISDSYYSLVDNDYSLQEYLDGENNIIEGIRLKLDNELTRNGILIHTTATGTLFLNYHKYQDMKIYVLDLARATYRTIDEYLTVEELRRVIGDLAGGGSGGELTPETLHNVLEGSDEIVADINEAGTKVVVKLDENFKDELVVKETLVDSETIVVDEHEDGTIDFNLATPVLNKVNKALTTPNTAPAGTVLVGIDTNNAQKNVNLDSSLALANGTLSVPLKDVDGTNVGTFRAVKLTQAEYDGLATKNASTLYIVVED